MAKQSPPPPLPYPDQPFRTYLWAAVMLMPPLFVGLFASAFLLPKLEQIWKLTGLSGSRVQWLMDASYGFRSYSSLVIAGVVIVLLLVESKWAAWPRYRGAVVGAITVMLNTAVLVGITTIAVSIALAAPLLAKSKAPEAAVHVDQ